MPNTCATTYKWSTGWPANASLYLVLSRVASASRRQNVICIRKWFLLLVASTLVLAPKQASSGNLAASHHSLEKHEYLGRSLGAYSL